MIILSVGFGFGLAAQQTTSHVPTSGVAAKSTGVCLVCMVLPGPRRKKQAMTGKDRTKQHFTTSS